MPTNRISNISTPTTYTVQTNNSSRRTSTNNDENIRTTFNHTLCLLSEKQPDTRKLTSSFESVRAIIVDGRTKPEFRRLGLDVLARGLQHEDKEIRLSAAQSLDSLFKSTDGLTRNRVLRTAVEVANQWNGNSRTTITRETDSDRNIVYGIIVSGKSIIDTHQTIWQSLNLTNVYETAKLKYNNNEHRSFSREPVTLNMNDTSDVTDLLDEPYQISTGTPSRNDNDIDDKDTLVVSKTNVFHDRVVSEDEHSRRIFECHVTNVEDWPLQTPSGSNSLSEVQVITNLDIESQEESDEDDKNNMGSECSLQIEDSIQSI